MIKYTYFRQLITKDFKYVSDKCFLIILFTYYNSVIVLMEIILRSYNIIEETILRKLIF